MQTRREIYRSIKDIPEEDNLLSYFAHQPVEGRMLELEEVLAFSNNIIIGGVDTTTALTSHALEYLANHPEAKTPCMPWQGNTFRARVLKLNAQLRLTTHRPLALKAALGWRFV